MNKLNPAAGAPVERPRARTRAINAPGRRTAVGVATAAMVAVAASLASSASAAPVPALDKLYTLDGDFDQGTLVDVNHDAPNNDQLQLSKASTPFPFVNIAASQRGTAVRIDVDTGQITGEYRTAPDGRGRNPSRTTVDKLGNVWVSNRDEAQGGKGSVARLGLVTGGTRANADGSANPAGQYLKGPYAYNTCQDRDADGLLKTSSGLTNILPWSNTGGADNDGGVSTAQDECIVNYTRVTGTNTRTVAVDANNDVWTGGSDTDHEQLSGVSGEPVPGTQIDFGCGGYGGLIDLNGTLWSARFGANLLRYVPGTGSATCLNTSHGDYGLGLDPITGDIWHTRLTGNRVYKLDQDSGAVLASFPHGNDAAQGVAVDKKGNVWVAHSLFGATTVGHLRTDGTYVGNVTLPGGNGPTGVAVDTNGKVWVANINSNNAQRIDPDAGPIGGGGFRVGAVDMTVDLGAGAGPYNYSDMTGAVLGEITAPQGTWTVVQDGGSAGTPWGKVTWNTEPQGSEANGSTITVQARASDTEAGLAGEAFVPVSNGTTFTLVGRYIEVRATLNAAGDGTSPVLSDLQIETSNRPPDCSGVTAGPNLWPPNHKFNLVSLDGASDPDGDPTTITITGVTQDEPVNEKGDGNTAPDASAGPSSHQVSLRAERSGRGDGRVYRIAFTVSDGRGGLCDGTTTVGVSHDQGGQATPVDSAPPGYDSFGS